MQGQSIRQRVARRFAERQRDKCGDHICPDLNACSCYDWADDRKYEPIWVDGETEEDALPGSGA